MPDYQRGKIYRITSGDMTYIGSTCEPTLAKRLANHVVDYKRWKANKRRFVTSFPLIESGDYTISLIELCPCGSKDEMTARERFWIESMTCVNRVVPGRTTMEYYETHKEHIHEKQKVWEEENKEQIAERKRAYYLANKEHINALNKKWQEANKEHFEELKKIWYETKKESINERRRANYQKIKVS